MPRHQGIVVRVLTWNLFHGRDAPPNRSLHTWRSRLLRRTETDATHAQVNRSLLEEFGAVLAGESWDVALLQEAPPRWLRPLCRRAAAHGRSALTSRNLLAAARARLADWNPDLMASGEGGSNQLLVRPPWRIAAERRLTLARRPERRRMLWARLERPGAMLAVANMHLSGADHRAAREVRRAAAHAVGWAGEAPLLFGGDLNLRPAEVAGAFRDLEERFGIAGPTGPGAIDHLLVRGLEVLDPPRALPPERREVDPGGHSLPRSGASAAAGSLDEGGGLAVRLSDHAPVLGRFRLAADPAGAPFGSAPGR